MTDIWLRGVPWTLLVWRDLRMPNVLNLDIRNRISVALVRLAAVALAVGKAGDLYCAIAAVLLGAVLWTNRWLYRFFGEHGGTVFAAQSAASHVLHLFNCGIAFALGWGCSWRGRRSLNTRGRRERGAESRGRVVAVPEEGPRSPSTGARLQGARRWSRTVAAIQWASGAYHSDFSAHPDEAAHAVSSLLVHDYAAAGFPGNPVKFAESYYVHYPKVGIGRWPPLFYASEGAWMLAFGRSRAALLSFAGMTAAALLLSVFLWVAGECGAIVGMAAALALAAAPFMQIATSSVSPNLLFTWVSVAIAYSRWLESGESITGRAVRGAGGGLRGSARPGRGGGDRTARGGAAHRATAGRAFCSSGFGLRGARARTGVAAASRSGFS